ncbi:BPSL0761 family protein [Pseudomonas sp. NFX224]|uniref:BPSL0761 family protein n=1 Tax=Pseudomonas sp. NFX224 TaxID=3402862 RepID=UPI003AFA4B7A
MAQTHAFLPELARDTEVPERVRQNSHFLLRHSPTKYDVLQAGLNAYIQEVEKEAETKGQRN